VNILSMGEIVPLAETHQVHAVELQGHGRTTDIDRPITHPDLAHVPDGFFALVEMLIALEFEPQAWGQDVAAIESPVIVRDAVVFTLEHAVAMLRLPGDGIIGDKDKPLPASRPLGPVGDDANGRHQALPAGETPQRMS